MTSLRGWKTIRMIFLFAVATVAANAQTFKTLVDFEWGNGAGPDHAALAQGRDGNLYGATSYGGVHDDGTIFSLTPEGTLATLYSFCGKQNCADGQHPFVGLVLATDGNFYGTTWSQGKGSDTVFGFAPHQLITVDRFAATNPSGLMQANDGSLYGTTRYGGSTLNGTIFKIAPSGVVTILYSFCVAPPSCSDGSSPSFEGLVQATDGNFYGTTERGGAHQRGTVFKFTPGGVLTALYSFCAKDGCADGQDAQAGLIQGRDGNLYGTTNGGGGESCSYDYGCGTIFKVTPGGKLVTLHIFHGEDGRGPSGNLVQGTDGNLYGSTLGGGRYDRGTLFEFTPDGKVTTLHVFDSTDGSDPSPLYQSTNGIFYGTSLSDGPFGLGTVFSLDMGLGPFVSLPRNSGKVGSTGGILGQGFTGTTDVSLNGTSATFTIVSDTYLTATIPPGATSGYVTVTTPSGKLTSNKLFRVIP